MDTNTMNRIREHETAQNLMSAKDYIKAGEIMKSAGNNYGFNVQLTFDLADCCRKTEDFEGYMAALSSIDTLTAQGLLNTKSQVVAQYMVAKNNLHDLKVATAIDNLSKLVWVPGISTELRSQIVVDYVLLCTLFGQPIEWNNIEAFHERTTGAIELDLVIALAQNKLEGISIPEDAEIDLVLMERLIHTEKVLYDTSHLLNTLACQIKKSDGQYLNSLINDMHEETYFAGLASYSKFDYVLRQLFRTDLTKVNLQNVVSQTQTLEPRSQRLWRKLTTLKNNDIVKLVVDLDNHTVTTSLGVLDLNRKRIHLRFFHEFADNSTNSLDDLAYEVWNQRYDEKIYNRIRIFLQRLNKELYPVTGRAKVFQLETPDVRLMSDVQIFIKSSEYDETAS